MDNQGFDLEIFAKTSNVHSLTTAIASVTGEFKTYIVTDETIHIYQNEDVLVVLQPSEDEFFSVWIRGRAPWKSSPELARYMANNLQCLVRCSPEPEFPEISAYSDVFLQVEGKYESLITWS